MTNDELDQLSINTIRTLSIDAVQQAKSGHPGTPMSLAPLVYTIWNRVMQFDPEAAFTQQQQNLQRQRELFRTHVNALQNIQNAEDSFDAARAQLTSAKANLELARLNLSYTKVFAPVDGYVTKMNTSDGTYVTAGIQLMALVDTSSYCVAGYFKENQLPHIHVGQKALPCQVVRS